MSKLKKTLIPIFFLILIFTFSSPALTNAKAIPTSTFLETSQEYSEKETEKETKEKETEKEITVSKTEEEKREEEKKKNSLAAEIFLGVVVVMSVGVTAKIAIPILKNKKKEGEK